MLFNNCLFIFEYQSLNNFHLCCFQKSYVQKYKKEWEAIPTVKPWISESIHGDQYFYCRLCKKDYKCGKTEIFKHMSAMKHKRHLMQTAQGPQVRKK